LQRSRSRILLFTVVEKAVPRAQFAFQLPSSALRLCRRSLCPTRSAKLCRRRRADKLSAVAHHGRRDWPIEQFSGRGWKGIGSRGSVVSASVSTLTCELRWAGTRWGRPGCRDACLSGSIGGSGRREGMPDGLFIDGVGCTGLWADVAGDGTGLQKSRLGRRWSFAPVASGSISSLPQAGRSPHGPVGTIHRPLR
jgi:hypothetical protein